MRRWVLPVVLVWAVASAQTEPLTFDQIVAAQVALDRLWFSPGTIDGKWGTQTAAAMAAWQIANGRNPTGEMDPALTLPDNVYTHYVVTAEDVALLGDAPEDWLERSRCVRMACRTMWELLGEKFHCREELLHSLNPALADCSAGMTVRVPDVWHGVRPPKAARVRVRLNLKIIRVFDENNRVLAHFPCSIAAREEKRPVGTLTVQSVALNPNYTFDPENFPELDEKQRGYGKLIIPPGPNNPVGTAWIGLSMPGYGMHGTPHPAQIGRTESHGCFRLTNWDAERLAHIIEIGTPVEVVAE